LPSKPGRIDIIIYWYKYIEKDGGVISMVQSSAFPRYFNYQQRASAKNFHFEIAPSSFSMQ